MFKENAARHCASARDNVAMTENNDPLPPLPQLPLGRYEHYKKRPYEVLGVVRHSETQEAMVLYRPLYGDSGLWVRPYAMFVETVEVDGIQQPRFKAVNTTT